MNPFVFLMLCLVPGALAFASHENVPVNDSNLKCEIEVHINLQDGGRNTQTIYRAYAAYQSPWEVEYRGPLGSWNENYEDAMANCGTVREVLAEAGKNGGALEVYSSISETRYRTQGQKGGVHAPRPNCHYYITTKTVRELRFQYPLQLEHISYSRQRFDDEC